MTLKRGLVLEGGGAKGAWQFGVLKALSERGLKFDVVSGTSVGALNGAIWSASRIDIGDKLWGEMSLSHVFLQRPWLIPALIIGGLAQLYFAFLNSFIPPDEPLPKLLEWIFSALTVLPLLVGIAGVFGAELDGGHWIGVLIEVPVAILILGLIFLDRTLMRLQMLMGFALLAAMMIVGDIWGPVDWEFINRWDFWVATAPLFFVGLARVVRSINLSYFSPEPLLKTIEFVLHSGLNVPLFVTASREVFSYLDPDNVDYVKENEDSEDRYPLHLSTMTAVYSRIDNVSPDEAREALLSSSALPFGIVPARRDNEGRRLVDGGMVDNIPWFPCIETFPCDEIVIVQCNPAKAWDDQASKDIWQIKSRLIRVFAARVRLNPEKLPKSVHNNPPTEIPFQPPTHWPRKVIVIAPAETLGTFKTGTMNFSKQSTANWMKAGYDVGKLAAL